MEIPMKKVLFATKETRLVEDLKRGYYLRCMGQVEYYDLALELTIAAAPDGVLLAEDLMQGIEAEGLTFQQCLEAVRQIRPDAVVVRQKRDSTAISLASELGLSRRPPDEGLVLAVYSLRGGVGKSTVAANLAWESSQAAPTILLDLDLRGGTVRHLLGVGDTEGGLYQLARRQAPLDGELEGFLAWRGPLALLLPPDTMEACLDDSLSPDFLADLIRRLALHFTNVVIDLAPDLVHSPAVATALMEANRILLLAQPTRAGLAGLPHLLPILADLGLMSKIGLVLSRGRGEVDTAGLGKDLGMPVLGQIPEDKAVAEAEEARQLAISNPKSPAAQALKLLASAVKGAGSLR